MSKSRKHSMHFSIEEFEELIESAENEVLAEAMHMVEYVKLMDIGRNLSKINKKPEYDDIVKATLFGTLEKYKIICKTSERIEVELTYSLDEKTVIFEREFKPFTNKTFINSIVETNHIFFDKLSSATFNVMLREIEVPHITSRFSFFESPIELEDKELGKTDFKNSIFWSEMIFSGVEFAGVVEFSGSIFKSKTCFANSRFFDALFLSVRFEGSVNFNGADFINESFFYLSKFLTGSTFREVNFRKGSYFADSVFKQSICFNGSTFRGVVDFFRSIFEPDETVEFDRVEFYGKVMFNSAKFNCGGVSFLFSRFENEAFFEHTSFHVAQFEGAVFSNRVVMTIATKIFSLRSAIVRDIMHFEIEDGNIPILDLYDMQIIGIMKIDWDKLKLKHSLVESNQYIRENFYKTPGYDSEKENKRSLKWIVRGFQYVNNIEVASQFRMLKENYHKMGLYNWEDAAYVSYMDITLRDNCQKWKNILTSYSLLALGILGDYGTNPRKIFGFMLLIPMLFGLLFSSILGGLPEYAGYELIDLILAGLRMSFVSFLTMSMGVGDPPDALQNLLIIDGFVGFFLMSYFVATLVRKTLR